MKRVLSIGNCGFDNGSLRSVLAEFAAELAAAEDWSEAEALLARTKFDLVLVNRKLDSGGDGLEVVRAMKASPELAAIPVMLLSNYLQYQAQAIAEGAEPGFGKAEVQASETRERLRKFLQ